PVRGEYPGGVCLSVGTRAEGKDQAYRIPLLRCDCAGPRQGSRCWASPADREEDYRGQNSYSRLMAPQLSRRPRPIFGISDVCGNDAPFLRLVANAARLRLDHVASPG